MLRLLPLLFALNAAAAPTPIKVLRTLPKGVADDALTVLATPAESSVNLWSLATGKQLAHVEIPVIAKAKPEDWNQITIHSVRPDLKLVLLSCAHGVVDSRSYTVSAVTEFFLVSTDGQPSVKKLWRVEGPCNAASSCTGVGRFAPSSYIDSALPLVRLLAAKYYAGHLDDFEYRGWVELVFGLDGKKAFEDETVWNKTGQVKGAAGKFYAPLTRPRIESDAQSCIVKIGGKQVSFLEDCVADDNPEPSSDDKRALSRMTLTYKSWDVATGALRAKFGPELPKGKTANGLWAESPDGRVALLQTTNLETGEDELQIWDARSGKRVKTFTGPTVSGVFNIKINGALAVFDTNEKKGDEYVGHTSLVDLELTDAPSAPVAAPAAAKVDVDELPSVAAKLDPDAYAVVIGVEKYRQAGVPAVDYASRDAKTMAAYLGAMGFDAKNVALLTDAQAGKVDFDKYFGKWLKNRVGPKSRVFVYYAGHGAPNPTTGAGYLMPYEADPSYLEETAYPVTRLYAELAKLPTKDVTIVLDACFSGQGERSLIAKGTRPLVPVQAARGPENAAVIAAASGVQISASDHEARHGLLTYHLLAGLQGEADANADGKITTSELFSYARPAVERAAKLQNVEQTPTVSGDTGAAGARVWTTTNKR